jgi:exodeoxyribonuclease V gamma subunit
LIRLCYSNRTEALLEALAQDLAAARTAGHDLYEATPLVVPNPQIETYVKLGIARQNGVAAHLTTRYLRGYLTDVVAKTDPEVAIIERETIEGELLALFHDARRLNAAELAPLADYLGAAGEAPDPVDRRRYQLASQLATLFDEYSFTRPELLRAWRDGRYSDGPGAPDADKGPMEVWQRALWRALFLREGAFEERGRAEGRRYVDLPTFFGSTSPRALQVPRATHVFGISYVARLYREVFAALGQAGEVFIYTLNPCREYWEDLDVGRAGRARAADRARFPRRRAGEQLSLGALAGDEPDETPALALWARPGRENIKLLNQLSDCDFASRFHDPLEGRARPTLLSQLQHDILDRVPARDSKTRLDLADDSIALLPCPDPRRELETIAAEIWRLMQPGLRFTDVAIVVPPSAAQTYLPLVAAVLREASDLPHTIIDAPAVTDSRVLEAVSLLLALPLGRLGRPDLLRLVMHPVVAARFPDADPRDWLALAEELDIVHGADRNDHAGTYLDADHFNWDQGLRRLALGAFLGGRRSGEERAFAFGGERYLAAELSPELQTSAQGFGVLARALIGFATRARAARLTIADWTTELRREIATTLVPGGPKDEQTLTRVFAELQRLGATAPTGLRVGYRIVHELVAAALDALPSRAGRYLTQGVTVSTFLPMRAVPFAAVFLAGMGERQFPANDRARELDLRGESRLPGDVSAREQDQYMFLETLLCTRERLVVSYVDRDDVTGEAIGPSSTVLDLLDVLKAGYLRGGVTDSITRPGPPLRRHEDDAACAVIPAAARERRAAKLGQSLREAAGGRGLPEWATLRGTLGAEALAGLGPALAWAGRPHLPPSARQERDRRVLPFSRLLRFLQCPLQGSALALLPLGSDDGDQAAAAAFREHEDFELARPRALGILREALAGLLTLDPAAGDEALTRAYEDATAAAVLDGTLPRGTFGAAARTQHLELLRCWRQILAQVGDVQRPPAPVWIGHGPEYGSPVTILAAPRLELDIETAEGSRRLDIELHGATNLLASIGGASTSLLLTSSTTKDNGSRRDRLRGFIDHVMLAAAHPEGAPERRILILRPGQEKPEQVWLRPLEAEVARRYLARLATAMLEGVHPYFFPCEGVLGWYTKSPRPALLDYIPMLRDDSWTRFSSDWGPIPGARDYPLPETEEAALRMTEDRFGLYFATIDERSQT